MKFYVVEVMLVFEYLYVCNIIYWDLKFENFLLDCYGYIKIIDFGFVKCVLDKMWMLCGMFDYFVFEVVSNKGYNKFVDWWLLGILIYEMFCGYILFWDSGFFMKIYENIFKGRIKYLVYLNLDV